MLPSLFDASGVFETCRVSRGRVLRLEQHLQRLAASLKTLDIGTGYPEGTRYRLLLAEIRRKIAAAACGMKEGTVRVAVRREGSPRILIHRHAGRVYPDRLYRAGVSIRTSASVWPGGDPAVGQAKASERVSGILARMDQPAAFEVLRLGRQGYLTEGTVSNLFLVRGGELITPPGWLGVLEGVTKDRVLRAARRLRLPVRQVPVTRHDLFNAEEAFLTNVLMTVLPVREADGRRIGSRVPGVWTQKLMGAVR